MEGLNANEWSGVRNLVAFLLVLQLVSVVLMWTLNPIGQRSEASFALLLAADLVAFSIISYVSRVRALGRGIREPFVLVGSAAVFLFTLLALIG